MKLYVVAKSDYDEHTIIGIYSSQKRAKKIRAKFNRLIREEHRAHLHYWKNDEYSMKMWRGAPHARCTIDVFDLNNEAVHHEQYYQHSIKFLLKHVHEKIKIK